jgi:hypothetical protein
VVLSKTSSILEQNKSHYEGEENVMLEIKIKSSLAHLAVLAVGLTMIIGLSLGQAYSQMQGGLEAYYQGDAIQIRWDAVNNSQAVGYNLYRLLPTDTAWTKLNESPIQVPKYRDFLQPIPVTVTYRVVPVDAQGAEFEKAEIRSTFTKLQGSDGEAEEEDPDVTGTCPTITPTTTVQRVTGAITAAGQFRDWCFTAAAGQRFEFSTCPPEGSGTFDTVIEVLTGDGSRSLDCNDDGPPPCGLLSRLTFTAPSAGQYRIRVSAFGGSRPCMGGGTPNPLPGNFTLGYRAFAPPPSCAATITPTTTFQTIAGSIAASEFRDYCFNVTTSGDRFEFTTCAPGSAAFDAFLEVRNADASIVLAANDHACGPQARVTWTAPSTGQFRARIRGAAAASGAFNMAYRVTEAPGMGGSATNGIYTIFVGPDGRYTARTGPNHPVPGGRNLLYDGKRGRPNTTYNTVKSWTTNTNYTQGPFAGATNLQPFVTYNRVEGTGIRTVYELPGPPQTPDKLRIEQLVRINGTTIGNTTIEVTTTVTNTGTTPVAIGVRYLWDFQIGQDDGPTFQEIGPDGPVRILETQFNSPQFTAYRIVNNDFCPCPLYAVFGTVTGPVGIVPPPTPPDRVDFACWPTSFPAPFEYTVVPTRDIATRMAATCSGFSGGDSSVNYYFGSTRDTAINLAAGRSFTFSESIFALPPRALPRFDVPPTPASRCPENTFRVQAGTQIQFPVQASHPTAGTNVTLGVNGLPTGASFPIPTPANPVSSTFTWTPTAAQVGSYSVNFTATSGPDVVTQCIRIEVVMGPPPTNPPTFDSPPTPGTAPITVRAASRLTFSVQASDLDVGDVVRLSVSGLPADASFAEPKPANPVISTFRWTPTRSQIGTYMVTFTATDNKARTATRVVTIQVIEPGPDTTAPHCGPISLRPEMPRSATILVRDINSGLDTLTAKSDNADVMIPSFTRGTNDRVVVTATKQSQDDPAYIRLDYADVAGNRDSCQFVSLSALAGQSTAYDYQVRLPQRGKLLIENRGLDEIVFYLNDTVIDFLVFEDAAGTCDGTTCYITQNGTNLFNLSPYLMSGAKTVALDAYGGKGAFAELLVSE